MEWVLLGLNTLGLLGYLYWLVSRAGEFMYSQDGILYLLPCIPFFFVYLTLLRHHDPDDSPEDED